MDRKYDSPAVEVITKPTTDPRISVSGMTKIWPMTELSPIKFEGAESIQSPLRMREKGRWAYLDRLA